MLDIAMPKIEILEADEQYGRFKIEPLDPGYGHTLGNALRRVLLSSIPGAAVSKIKIEGVYDPFAPLEGVREDVTELMLNLKALRVRMSLEAPIMARLSCHGAGPVLAQALDLPAGVELVNPEHYLCTLENDEVRLEVEVTIEQGQGYVPADQRDPLPLGEIPVDAMFTPVPRVHYEVENTRIGQATDFDRLLVEVWTDGSIKPGDALGYAAHVLVQYSQTVADFNRVPFEPDEIATPAGFAIPADVYDTAIEELDLSTRTYNCLKRADIMKVGQVLQMDEKALLSVRNLGQKSMEEIRDRLVERGYIPKSLVTLEDE
ncbi:DNA-directed RNA polymerase subunit alpha [Candidatus Viridilinea mediisalina]|uniref:DNA-directed RNA polymerase subunit alpha n=1 Tax=Candidatus Viridilinea mediisalina TaxID=2024553 RepID=A0A2A6RM94_9CHLR|nr:DNA-directed RNA polymerase subunit alpha [Candidatus Viridilinea mediisalina]PDW04182.1 DNA-directed RNA polymerase subunit alpha [Candidatus Viridilinea mediisalina]